MSVIFNTIVIAPIGKSEANCSTFSARKDSFVTPSLEKSIPTSVVASTFSLGKSSLNIFALVSTSNLANPSAKSFILFDSDAILCTVSVFLPYVFVWMSFIIASKIKELLGDSLTLSIRLSNITTFESTADGDILYTTLKSELTAPFTISLAALSSIEAQAIFFP